MGQKIVKQRLVVDKRVIRAVVKLGMPLHAEEVGWATPAQGFDDAIGLRPGLDDQIATEIPDRLVAPSWSW